MPGTKPWEKYAPGSTPVANAEPGVQAVGTTDGTVPSKGKPWEKYAPSASAPPVSAVNPDELPENADWVDKAAYYGNKVIPYGDKAWEAAKKMHPMLHLAGPAASLASKALNLPAAAIGTGIARGIGMFTPGENPIGIEDATKSMLGQEGFGDQLVKLGVTQPQDGFSIPGTNGKKLSSRAIENALAGTAFNPFSYSGFRKNAGARLYDNSISPIEIEGERMGKPEMGQRMRKMGLKNPLKLNEQAQEILNEKMDLTGGMEDAATKAGGTINVDKAVTGPQAIVDSIKKNALDGSVEQRLAKRLQREIDIHKAASPGGQVFTPKPEEPIFINGEFQEPPPTRTAFKQKPEQPVIVPGEAQQPTTRPAFKQNPEVPVYDAGTEKAETDLAGMTHISEGQNGKLLYGPKGADGRPIAGPEAMTPVVHNPNDVIRSLPVSGEHVQVPLAPQPQFETSTKGWKRTDPSIDRLSSLPVQGEHVQVPMKPQPQFETSTKGWQQVDPSVDRVSSLPVQGEMGVAPTIPTEQGVQLKRDATGKAKTVAYDNERRNTREGSFYKSLGGGLKEAVEDSIEQTLGPEARQKYVEANADAGALLSTTKARARVQNQNTRLANSATTPFPNGTEGLVGALEASEGGLGHGAFAIALQKTLKALQLSQMPVGYYLNKSANSVLPTAAIAGNAALTAGPWAIKGDDDGKK